MKKEKAVFKRIKHHSISTRGGGDFGWAALIALIVFAVVLIIMSIK